MLYSWSDVQEVHNSSPIAGISRGGYRDVYFAPPNFLYTFNSAELNTSFVVSSRTTLLSLGDLPVLSPDDTDRAPVSVTVVG